MKLSDLAGRIAQKTGLTVTQAEDAVNALKDTIAEELQAHDKFYLYGLGTFQIQTRKGRRGRNPQTGQLMQIPPRRVIKWSPSKMFERNVGVLGPLEEGAASTGTTAKPGASETTFESPEDFLGHDAGSTLEHRPPVGAPPTPAELLDDGRLLRRARTMAKVSIDDIFLYFGEALRQALQTGQDPTEVVEEQLEQAKATLARRVGNETAAREDFIGEAFRKKLEELQA